MFAFVDTFQTDVKPEEKPAAGPHSSSPSALALDVTDV